MKQIKVVRCSGLSRPMTCAGSLFFEDLPEEEEKEAAKEGTAFGELMERILTGQQITTHAKNGVAFDDDMRFFGAPLIENIVSRAQSEVLCEQSVDWQTRSGIWIKGTCDVSYVHNGKLCIDDFKYGWKLVEVEENWQLLGYAIGEVMRRGIAYDRIVLRILQPRPHHENGVIREWEITYDQLLEYKEQIESRMDKIASGFAELATSSKCKYCPAAASACTAFNRAVFHGVDYVLSHFQQDDINEKEISFQLDLMDRISEVLKIKTDSIKQLAVSRIKNGAIIPNYMTENSYGDRKWKPGISPEVIEVLTGKKIVEQVMLSPAKAEKIGVPKELVAGYVDRFFLGPKLVRKDANKLGEAIFGKPKGG